MRMIKSVSAICIFTFFGLAVGQDMTHALSGKTRAGTHLDESLRLEVQRGVLSALSWLAAEQNEDGSWGLFPAMTGLVLSGMMRSSEHVDVSHPVIARGYQYLESCVHEDGGIHQGELPNYNTSICLIAFKDARQQKYESIIQAAEDYLIRLQIDEKTGYTPDSLWYGGVGYGGDGRPDMSNLQWAIEAIQHETGSFQPEKHLGKEELKRIQEKALFYDKALVFLARCQNLASINPEEYAGDDGGFMYEPGKSKAGGSRSYGSMSYTGLKSMVYASLDKDDLRVKAVVHWIEQNYRVDKTPFMDDTGLYYYYQTMAKSLQAYGQELLVDAEGESHAWRAELANQLLKTQNEEGWWQNSNGRWMENNRVLVTSYSVLALEEILK